VFSILQAVLDGVLVGGVYGVLAVGLSLVFGVLGIVNFAHAEFVMVGMYVAWALWKYAGLDPLVGSVVSLAVGFALGFAVQRFLIQRVLQAQHVAQIFLTVGLAIVLENSALLLFGADYRAVQTPYQTSALAVGPLLLSVPYLAAFSLAVLASISLWWFMTKTWTGRAIRATAQNSHAATLYGIDSKWVYAVAFGLGTGLTAFGGGVILPYASASPAAGAQYVVLMFTVVVLGGLGSVLGALVGGVIAGVIQSLSAVFLPLQLQNLTLFVAFISLLAFKPEGILGKKRR
jgi:branched-chain amino acid transport system permease protein